jgi:5-methyltetrahydrofolate--homocysteine methyltransferase
MTSDILKQLEEAVIEMKTKETEALTKEALDEGHSAVDILNGSLLPALDRVGILFQDGDYFLPDVLMSTKAYHGSYALLEPELKAGNHAAKGKILLGTIAGDIHDIGKKILAALLAGNGFDVVDLGVDVAPEDFLARAKEEQPDIIGMSALLTTTMTGMKDVVDHFTEAGIRQDYKIIVGGAPLSQNFADEIGADGYGEDAQSGVDLVKRLIG